MPWIRLDDAFLEHPKFLGLSAAHVGMWVAGLAYARKTGRTGFIPASKVPRLLHLGFGRNGARMARKLVEVGLWHEVDGGFEIHDFVDFLPPERNSAIELGRMGGQASGEARQGRVPSASGARPVRVPSASRIDPNLSESFESANGKTNPRPAPTRPGPTRSPLSPPGGGARASRGGSGAETDPGSDAYPPDPTVDLEPAAATLSGERPAGRPDVAGDPAGLAGDAAQGDESGYASDADGRSVVADRARAIMAAVGRRGWRQQ